MKKCSLRMPIAIVVGIAKIKKTTLGYPNVVFRLRFFFSFQVRVWKKMVHSNGNQCANKGVQNSLNRIGGILSCLHIKEND